MFNNALGSLHITGFVYGEILSRSAPRRGLQSENWWCYCRLRAQSISRVLSSASDQCLFLLSSLRGWALGKSSTVTLMFSAQWICPTVILSHLLLQDISSDRLQQSYKMSWINWQNSRPHMFTLFACLSNWIICFRLSDSIFHRHGQENITIFIA